MTQQVDRAGRRTTVGLALILSVQLMLILDMTVVNVALPEIATDLGFTPSALSWVLNAYTLTFGGLLLLGGRLGDVFGRRRTFVAGLSVFTLGSLLGGLAPTPELLVAARSLQGAGAAVAAPSVLALLTSTARDEGARNRSLGLFSAVSSAGGSIGLILGGALTGYASWRWSLFINVPIGLLVLLLVPRFVDETPRQRWPLRRDRRRHGDSRLGQPRLRLHQRARPRLDLGRHGRRVRARRGAARRFRRQRASRRVPAARAGPAAQPDAGGRGLGDGALRGRAVRVLLLRGAVHAGRARVRRAALRLRVPAAHAADLRHLPPDAAPRRAVRGAPAGRDRRGARGCRQPLAGRAGHVEHVCRPPAGPDGAHRHRRRAELHAADRGRAGGRRSRARGHGVGAAADGAADRRCARPRGARDRVRLAERAGSGGHRDVGVVPDGDRVPGGGAGAGRHAAGTASYAGAQEAARREQLDLAA